MIFLLPKCSNSLYIKLKMNQCQGSSVAEHRTHKAEVVGPIPTPGIMEKKKMEKLIATAKNLVGRPYKYGAKPSEAPHYFDCSSFIQYVYKLIGYNLPRSTIEQAGKGKKINNIKNIQPGDLIFLHGTKGHYNKKFPIGIGHVVMYFGDSKIIHASSKRIKNSPKIVEKGAVKIEPFSKILKRPAFAKASAGKKDIVVIKRILK